jgi:hypothetical protein
VLDALAWGLRRSLQAQHRAARRQHPAAEYSYHHDNGLVVERKGKNSDLKVIDPSGEKSGQQLLNSFVEQLALDLPRFHAG